MSGLPYLRKLSLDYFEISVIMSFRVLKYGNICQKSWKPNTRTFSFQASCVSLRKICHFSVSRSDIFGWSCDWSTIQFSQFTGQTLVKPMLPIPHPTIHHWKACALPPCRRPFRRGYYISTLLIPFHSFVRAREEITWQASVTPTITTVNLWTT